jgi:hypothetical protein
VPAEFLEFEPHEFPIRLEAYDLFGDVVWSIEADGPGGLQVPMLRAKHGPVGVRVYCAGELRSDTPPPSAEYIDDLDARVERGEFG